MSVPEPSFMLIGEDIGPCQICCEVGADAEMYDPEAPGDGTTIFCHAECGIAAGLEVA